jgi:hypothetical protein
MRLLTITPHPATTCGQLRRTALRRHHAATRHPALRPLLVALGLSFTVGLASATSFTIAADSTAARTLGNSANETGTVDSGKSLTVSGSTVAVTVSGSNATLNNNGTIKQTGSGRVIRDTAGLGGLVINNGSSLITTALMQASNADVIQMNKSPAAGTLTAITLNNYGSMIALSASSQVVNFKAVAFGSNIVNNYATGILKASEADAVRPGVNGVVNNWGSIQGLTSTGSSSDGIDLQNNTGGSITNYGTGVITGGRHGITGGALDASVSFIASVTNLAGGVIQGSNGSGINLDGFNNKQLVTVVNGGSIIGTGVTGDGDGIDVDGLVNISNTGIIRSGNAFSTPLAGLAFSEGITVGGGTITNSGLIEGLVTAGNTNAVGRGITLSGNDITTGALAGTREGIYGNAVITNQAGGMIRGQTDSAIVAVGAASAFTVTIVNLAGATIQGGGSTAAAIRTGADKTAITNSGLIDGSSSGRAIEMGSGNNTLNITGGQAVVLGDISGGVGGHNVMTIQPGAGNSFAYAGSISNFDSVEVQSGNVSFSGVSSYAGTTLISGGVLELVGANRLLATSALALTGGTLKLSNAGSANGQTFSTLSLGADSVIDLGGSSISFSGLGTVTAGARLSIVDHIAAVSPLYAIRLVGNLSGDAGFQSMLAGMTINGLAATYHFDGSYTDVTAVPEPASIALLLAGLGLIAGVVRRRQA